MAFNFDEIVLRERWSHSLPPLAPRTMGLLPSASSAVSKVCVGDSAGVLHCIGFKRGKMAEVFTTPAGPPTTRLSIVKDKIFVASDTEVRGFSKKGRNFYNITTFMTERITAVFVHGNQLHLAGTHLYCHYVDNVEQPYYVSEAKIHDMCPLRVRGLGAGEAPAALLACGDRALRAVVGKDVGCHVPLNYSPTALCPLDAVTGGVAYGTSCGRLGAVALDGASHSELWMLDDGGDVLGAVTALCEGTVDGVHVVVAGHECGNVRVVCLGADGPEPCARVSVGSAVTSVAVGCVSSESSTDVIVASYSGSIVGFVAVPPTERVDDTAESYAQRADAVAAEVAALEKQLRTAQGGSGSGRRDRSGAAPAAHGDAAALVDVWDGFALVESDAAYLLTVELPEAIETVVFETDVPLSVRVGRSAEGAEVKFISTDGRHHVAAHACGPGTTRLEALVFASEGDHGSLEVAVFPALGKLCYRRRYPICALSLHQRVSDAPDEALPISTVTMTGAFGAADVDRWLSRCFTDAAPSNVQGQPRRVVTYRSTLADTRVDVTYEAGAATFRSDCLSTLAVLRDTISREATLSNTQVRMSSAPDFASVPHCLGLLGPRFAHHRRVAQQHFVAERLQELVTHEGSRDFLTESQRALLADADKVAREHTARPHHLRRLHDMVLRLYVDKCVFQRRNPAGLERLAAALRDDVFDVDEFIRLFDA